MLEQITELVKQFGREPVIDNPDVPNEQNNAVLAEASKTITGGMQNMLAGGGLHDIISMFKGAGGQSNLSGGGFGEIMKHPMVSMMVGHLINKLVGKFNFSPALASRVSNNLIPNVLNDLVNRTRDTDPSNDSFNLDSLIASLTGGQATSGVPADGGFNLQGLLSRPEDSGMGNPLNLNDIISRITENAQQNQGQQSKGGGISDLVKGFFNL